MTKTIITNPRLIKNPRGKPYLHFDLFIAESESIYLVVEKCVAKRLTSGALVIRGPIYSTASGTKTRVKFSSTLHDLIAERIEAKWGEGVTTKAAFTVY